MIREVSITNFKCFSRLTVSGLQPITLLSGQNNSGKSAFLEAILMFYSFQNELLTEKLVFGRYKYTPLECGREFWTALCFDKNKPIEIIVDEQNGDSWNVYKERYHNNSSNLDFHCECFILNKQNKEVQINAADYYVNEQNKIYIKSHHSKISRSFGLLIGESEDQETIANWFVDLDRNGRQEEILEVLRVVEPRLKRLAVFPMGKRWIIHGDIGANAMIPLVQMGDGIMRLLTITMGLNGARDGLFLVDEIENGFHYSVLPAVWQALAKAVQNFNCQLIATTHSYECLQAAHAAVTDESYQKGFVFIRLHRKENQTIPKYYSPEVLGAGLESDWEVR